MNETATAVINENQIGDILLHVDNVSVSFGAVRALIDISFAIHEHEILAIIGPNGAGKTTMLNLINGVYHSTEGTITFKGETRKQMRPHHSAVQGIARTFQNVALFKGMSTLDNIMTGRNLKMKSGLLAQALYWGVAQREEAEHREAVEHIIDFLEIQPIRKTPVGRLPYGLQKRVELGRALALGGRYTEASHHLREAFLGGTRVAHDEAAAEARAQHRHIRTCLIGQLVACQRVGANGTACRDHGQADHPQPLS